MSHQRADAYASMLGCKIDTGPISYLGATLGANPRSVRFWDSLIHKFSAKINSYDASRVSLAGKLCYLELQLTAFLYIVSQCIGCQKWWQTS